MNMPTLHRFFSDIWLEVTQPVIQKTSQRSMFSLVKALLCFTLLALGLTAGSAYAQVTNSPITLAKTWVNGFPGETVTGDITGGTGTPTSTSSTAPGAAVMIATGAGDSGTTITISETFTTPANAVNYNFSLVCNGNVTASQPTRSGGVVSATFTMPAAAVTCTFTNSRRSTDLYLSKIWYTGNSGDTMTATTTGGTNNATLTSQFNGTNNQIDSSALALVYAGDTITIPDEAFTSGSQANYTSQMSCIIAQSAEPIAPGDDGKRASGDSAKAVASQLITVLPNYQTINCTFYNTLKPVAAPATPVPTLGGWSLMLLSLMLLGLGSGLVRRGRGF